MKALDFTKKKSKLVDKHLKYEYFDLPNLLETLDKWDRQHDDTRKSDA